MKDKVMIARIVLTAVLTVAFNFLPVEGVTKFVLFFAVYLLIGFDVLGEAVSGIREHELLDEHFLMAVATLGAFGLAIYEKSGDYNEAIAVMMFYQIGEFFQSYAVGRSRQSISELMDIRPDYANIEKDGRLERVDPATVGVGSEIIVQPGERIPLDGTVISGCINLSGLLRVRTTKAFGESTVSRILELVEDSASRKSRSEAFISKFARIYTPAVCIAALALAVLPPLVRLASGMPGEWDVWIYRALIFLVISCPCALVVSIPLSFFAGIGGASRKGILVKGSNYLETLSKVRTVVFDKTGTLTKGVFEVEAVHHGTRADEELIEYAALAESSSSHPISKSLQRAYGREIDRTRVSDVEEISGQGVLATVSGAGGTGSVRVAAGNDKLMRRIGVEPLPCHCAGTIIHIALDGVYAGHIVISDVIKPNSAKALGGLKAAGVERTVMLTGDSGKVAAQVAGELGVDLVCSELLPADKVAKVEELMADGSTGGKLAFVGDGINDAPVLSRADIGIAMGAMGSDAAIEAADVVLMDDDPLKTVTAIRISRKCLRIVWQNIVFAISVKFACLLLGALGVANMWFAVIADVGVMVLAVLNAMRCLRIAENS